MELKVTDFLKQDELLAGLAEEAAELSQAALKLRRVLDGRNPTPKTYREAVRELNEEIADVLLYLEWIQAMDNGLVREFRNKKLARWVTRLMEAKDAENDA